MKRKGNQNAIKNSAVWQGLPRHIRDVFLQSPMLGGQLTPPPPKKTIWIYTIHVDDLLLKRQISPKSEPDQSSASTKVLQSNNSPLIAELAREAVQVVDVLFGPHDHLEGWN